MHAWNIAQTEIQNLDLYAGLVAVGGDGTLHEVINGMMFRADKKKVPIALIPNGTGNDLCNSVGVKSVEQALAFIKKGDLIQMDLNRVLMDAETEEEIPKDDNLFQRMRYSAINSGPGLLAMIVHKAAPIKGFYGQAAYPIAGL